MTLADVGTAEAKSYAGVWINPVHGAVLVTGMLFLQQLEQILCRRRNCDWEAVPAAAGGNRSSRSFSVYRDAVPANVWASPVATGATPATGQLFLQWIHPALKAGELFLRLGRCFCRLWSCSCGSEAVPAAVGANLVRGGAVLTTGKLYLEQLELILWAVNCSCYW